jgi:hypothetical protein
MTTIAVDYAYFYSRSDEKSKKNSPGIAKRESDVKKSCENLIWS